MTLLSPCGLVDKGSQISGSRRGPGWLWSCPLHDSIQVSLRNATSHSVVKFASLSPGVMVFIFSREYYDEGREELLMNILFNNQR
jgi:hypothetical protein